ncbi:MAG: peptide deformylase [Candidatus Beckwithbacteria bacterium]|nr:peptide deformylase [Patescibacteria group bacterium]
MLKIIKHPHPTLRKKALTINHITDDIKKLAKQMLSTLTPEQKKELGVGLATNQVNQLHRLFIIKMPDDKFEVCLNPQIIKSSKKMLSSLPKDKQFIEGCLSIPGYFGFVDRPIKIKAKYLNLKGLEKKISLASPFSSYFAHELDHLNGILFIDHIKKSGEPLYKANKEGKLEAIDNPFS